MHTINTLSLLVGDILMIYCPECETSCRNEEVFCPACGHALKSAAEAHAAGSGVPGVVVCGERGRERSSKWPVVLVALIIVGAALAGWSFYSGKSETTTLPVVVEVPSTPVEAVAPVAAGASSVKSYGALCQELKGVLRDKGFGRKPSDSVEGVIIFRVRETHITSWSLHEPNGPLVMTIQQHDPSSMEIEDAALESWREVAEETLGGENAEEGERMIKAMFHAIGDEDGDGLTDSAYDVSGCHWTGDGPYASFECRVQGMTSSFQLTAILHYVREFDQRDGMRRLRVECRPAEALLTSAHAESRMAD